jgi:intracellular septation protein
MQFFIEFLPILSFFAAYKFTDDPFVATGVMIGMLLVVVAFQLFKYRKVGPMLLVSAGIGILFGGLTIYFHEQIFVQWKPTVVYWVLAGALLSGRLFSKKPIVQHMMGPALPLDDAAWRTLNNVWAVAFTVIGVVNLYVVYHFDFNTWTNFKFYGLTGLMLVFALGQGVWLASKLPPETDTESAQAHKQPNNKESADRADTL